MCPLRRRFVAGVCNPSVARELSMSYKTHTSLLPCGLLNRWLFSDCGEGTGEFLRGIGTEAPSFSLALAGTSPRRSSSVTNVLLALIEVSSAILCTSKLHASIFRNDTFLIGLGLQRGILDDEEGLCSQGLATMCVTPSVRVKSIARRAEDRRESLLLL